MIHLLEQTVSVSLSNVGFTAWHEGAGCRLRTWAMAIPAAKAIGSQGKLTALDVQAGMLAHVQKKSRTAGLSNIRLMQAGLGEGKLEKDYYDRVMLVTVLGEIPEQEAALNEIYEALKPGSFLSVTEVIFDPHFQSSKSVQRVASKVGFRKTGFFGKRLAYTMHFEKKQ